MYRIYQQCLEGDESGRPGDWSEKMKNCLTPEEREVVDKCFKTKADDLLRDVRLVYL